ncbi:MAG: sulfatase-like hydrolase/transferase [Verrucomicrobia bacterium]|nr:sulfatase-like hydrolase/transferase [Verrucomicrobiota bacterium]
MISQPNLLFLLSDQHRADWLGCSSGLPLKTPNIDRLANEGTRFTRAITPSPVCSPARACLATGLDFEHCGVASIHENLPLDKPTYYQSLREAGYQVTGVGKFDLHKPDMDWGLDGKNLLQEYGFTDGIDSEGKGDAIWAYRKDGKPRGPYLKFLEDRGLLDRYVSIYDPNSENLLFEAINPLPDDAYCDTWIAQNGLDLLATFSKDQPWHLVVNFAGPHDPYDVTEAMRDRWKDVEFPQPVANDADDPEIILLRQQNYAAMIENIDTQVGKYLALLEERDELENTTIVYSSDHGEMLGDHNRWQKSIWYQGSVGVPLVVSGTGVRCQVSGALVGFHDIGATFLDYAGVEGLPDADAKSLRPVLEGEVSRHRRVLKSGLDNWRMIYDGRFKLILRQGEDALLYDLKEDPEETENVAGRYPCKIRQLSDL